MRNLVLHCIRVEGVENLIYNIFPCDFWAKAVLCGLHGHSDDLCNKNHQWYEEMSLQCLLRLRSLDLSVVLVCTQPRLNFLRMSQNPKGPLLSSTLCRVLSSTLCSSTLQWIGYVLWVSWSRRSGHIGWKIRKLGKFWILVFALTC